MIQFPCSFVTNAKADCGIATRWVVRSGEHEVPCTIPREFDGPGGTFSPEDLYAHALTNCFIATFQVMAEKSRVRFQSLEIEGVLVVDRDATKRPCMKNFLLKIRLESPSDPLRATNLVKKAFEGGFILNSVKTNLSYDLEIV